MAEAFGVADDAEARRKIDARETNRPIRALRPDSGIVDHNLGGTMAFDGFGKAAYDWLFGIATNNSREQFLATKAHFEIHVKARSRPCCTELSEEFGGTPKMFRQNRDIRFASTSPANFGRTRNR